MKVGFRVMMPEEAAEELEDLPKLVPMKLKKFQYKSLFDHWEAAQEKGARKQREG